MTTDRDSGLVDVTVRLGVGRFDHLVDVDAVLARVAGELVGETDIDVAVGGLRELRQLRGLGGPEIPHAVRPGEVVALIEVEHRLIELESTAGSVSRQRTDQLRVLAQVFEDAAGEHALWREHDVEVDAFGEAARLLQHGFPAVPGRSNRESRLVADESPSRKVLTDRESCRVHPSEVRRGIVVHEEWDDDDDRIRIRNGVSVVSRGAQSPGRHELGELLTEVRLAGEWLESGVDQFDKPRIHVDTDDVVPLRSELHSERQPDLAESDDGDFHDCSGSSGFWISLVGVVAESSAS